MFTRNPPSPLFPREQRSAASAPGGMTRGIDPTLLERPSIGRFCKIVAPSKSGVRCGRRRIRRKSRSVSCYEFRRLSRPTGHAFTSSCVPCVQRPSRCSLSGVSLGHFAFRRSAMNRQVSQDISSAARAFVPSGSWVRRLALVPMAALAVTGAVAKTTPRFRVSRRVLERRRLGLILEREQGKSPLPRQLQPRGR